MPPASSTDRLQIALDADHLVDHAGLLSPLEQRKGPVTMIKPGPT